MKTYLAFWPDETFTLCSATSLNDLFWTLDEEGDPYAAKVYALPNRFVITTDTPVTEDQFNVSDKRLVSFINHPPKYC
jgi:hypothetical protein